MSGGQLAGELALTPIPGPVFYKRDGGQSTLETEWMTKKILIFKQNKPER